MCFRHWKSDYTCIYENHIQTDENRKKVREGLLAVPDKLNLLYNLNQTFPEIQ